ncbi:TIGR01459 family HAD-type hydrolase [Rickettsiales endosymbiont of Stachyamoeba lipophora]|uniref:TIGR01459 family HAD-type hydrolase n=1 Tax=Rickettsiales endosymbiont of Stachyamoeba lipophora TaxID=2486578 RepID=UPI000F64EBE9|nr:TIGR01459 family HAD-type hydrolase [Rickettsiales endosymbiont of Stachyamoeba lipophora]AZL15468.1 TIGR01459 family HAD-type hydrolase [Rickettsiales endosymbiont of Stachyamoeba lipophora]
MFTNIYDILPQFKIIFCDLWGVIHDGYYLYPGALDFLKFCKNNNIKIVFVSNAPRRAFKAVKTLQKLEVGDELFEGMVTSGEVFYQHILNKDLTLPGNKYFYLGPVKDTEELSGLNLNIVDDLYDANFVMCYGYYDNKLKNEGLNKILEKIITLNLSFYCVNPDLVVITQDASQFLCAGHLAQKFETLGGRVIYFGKPYDRVYQYAYNLYADKVPKEQILMLGDSFYTDIKGANNFGIKSCLVTQGIFNAHIGSHLPPAQVITNLASLNAKYNAVPDYLVHDLRPLRQ